MSEEKWNPWAIKLTAATCIIWSAWLISYLSIGGLCDAPDLADNFEKEDYLGRWHQQFVAKGRFEDFQCVTATYAPIDETDIQVDNQTPTGDW